MSNKTYGFETLPNRRGTYNVHAMFKDCAELVKVTIAYDVDEETGIDKKSAYAYIVESLNGEHLYTACFGFATIKDTIAECRQRCLEII